MSSHVRRTFAALFSALYICCLGNGKNQTTRGQLIFQEREGQTPEDQPRDGFRSEKKQSRAVRLCECARGTCTVSRLDGACGPSCPQVYSAAARLVTLTWRVINQAGQVAHQSPAVCSVHCHTHTRARDTCTHRVPKWQRPNNVSCCI